jgi:hypothetical protein
MSPKLSHWFPGFRISVFTQFILQHLLETTDTIPHSAIFLESRTLKSEGGKRRLQCDAQWLRKKQHFINKSRISETGKNY